MGDWARPDVETRILEFVAREGGKDAARLTVWAIFFYCEGWESGRL